jgi:hypothetical protein
MKGHVPRWNNSGQGDQKEKQAQLSFYPPSQIELVSHCEWGSATIWMRKERQSEPHSPRFGAQQDARRQLHEMHTQMQHQKK